MTLSGSGNGSQQFLFPTVIDRSTGQPFAVPSGRGVYSYAAYGLLQYVAIGPATFDTLPRGRPFQVAPADQVARGCTPSSNPIRVGQQLQIFDAASKLIESWTVRMINQIPGAPAAGQIPLWVGSALPNGAYTSPYSIVASSFQPADSWIFNIPPQI